MSTKQSEHAGRKTRMVLVELIAAFPLWTFGLVCSKLGQRPTWWVSWHIAVLIHKGRADWVVWNLQWRALGSKQACNMSLPC